MQHKNKNNSSQVSVKSSQSGFSHLILPIAVVVVAVAGTGGLVLHASHHKTTQSISLADSSHPQAASPTSSASNLQVSQATPVSTPTVSKTTSPVTTTKVTATSNPTIKSSATTPTTSTATTSTASKPATVTPLSVLTSLISSIDAGQSGSVTASKVAIPGPIGTAQGQPLVFMANGQLYFAYTQEQQPNFNTTPSQTASSMAIVSDTQTGATLQSAYLDKAGILVGQDQEAVGYSTGGN